MLFATYPPWGDNGRMWDSGRTGLHTKPRSGLPWQSGGAPGTHWGLMESPLPYTTTVVLLGVTRVTPGMDIVMSRLTPLVTVRGNQPT